MYPLWRRNNFSLGLTQVFGWLEKYINVPVREPCDIFSWSLPFPTLRDYCYNLKCTDHMHWNLCSSIELLIEDVSSTLVPGVDHSKLSVSWTRPPWNWYACRYLDPLNGQRIPLFSPLVELSDLDSLIWNRYDLATSSSNWMAREPSSLHSFRAILF